MGRQGTVKKRRELTLEREEKNISAERVRWEREDGMRSKESGRKKRQIIAI